MHQANPGAANKLKIAERRGLALELRKQGGTYRNIADQLSRTEGISPEYSEAQAHRDVMHELGRINRHNAEQAEIVRRLELERLDDLLSVYYPQAAAGSFAAFDRVMHIMDRRAKLLGLDRVTQSNLNVDVSKLADEQLARIAAGEDLFVVLATSKRPDSNLETEGQSGA